MQTGRVQTGYDCLKLALIQMKHLLLLRHAKSSWDDQSLKDFDRPLKDRGVKAAKLVGQFLRREKIKIDLVISSPAKRARETIELVLPAAKLEVELKFDDRIYEASPRTLLAMIAEVKLSANTLMLVGHNPGFEGLLEVLTSESRHLPTASVAFIDLDSDQWQEARAGGKLVRLVTPKELSQ